MGPKRARRRRPARVRADRAASSPPGRPRSASRRPTREPSSISFFQGNDLSSVDDVDLVAGRLATVFALLGAEGSFGVKGTADRLLPDLLGRPAPASLRQRRRRQMTWVGFPVGIAVALLVVPAGVRGLLDAGLVRENYRGQGGSPSRSARCWRRRRWSPWRRSPSSTTAATSTCSTPTCAAGSPTCSASPSSASSTTRWARGERGRRAARLARPRPGAARGAALDRGDQGDRRAGARRLRRLRARPRVVALPRRRRAAGPRHQRLQPARPAARAGPRRRWRCSALGLCLGAWTLAPLELLGIFAGAGRWSAPGSRCASGRCSATPARTWSARSPGSGC